MAIIVFLLTFVVVAGVITVVWVLAGANVGQEQIRKRMNAVHKAERRGDVSQSLKLVRDEMLSDVPMLHRILLRWSWSSRLQDFLAQAGMRTKPAKILLLSAVLGLGSYLVAGFFFRKPHVSLPLGLAVATIPFLVVVMKRRRRLRKFEERTAPRRRDRSRAASAARTARCADRW